jgi:hypothetical protein
MKLQVRLYRAVQISLGDLYGAVGLPMSAVPEQAMHKLSENYGPLALCLRIFWPEGDPDVIMDPNMKVVVGLEVMGFDIQAAKVAQAGLVHHDPIIPEVIQRADGALQGELARLGIFTAVEKYDWRCAYEIRGN